MRLIAESGSEFSDEVARYYEHNGEYFVEMERKIEPITKLEIANEVGMYWDKDCIYTETNQTQNGYCALMNIPIYEDIYICLYNCDETEELAEKGVKEMFDDFIALNEKFEENIERNRVNQQKNMKCFAFIPDNDDCKNPVYENWKLVYFEDGETADFRELAVREGVPNDARADRPIFGYVEGDKLVFFKKVFFQGEFDNYIPFIKSIYKDIAEHYGLENYHVFHSMSMVEELCWSRKIDLEEDFITRDLAYYRPGEELKL